jgi:hypothetical protein
MLNDLNISFQLHYLFRTKCGNLLMNDCHFGNIITINKKIVPDIGENKKTSNSTKKWKYFM